MASIEQLIADDAWLLNTGADQYSAAKTWAVTRPFVATASVEFVGGSAHTGIYVASALSAGLRTVKGLVIDSTGQIQLVDALVQDDSNGLTLVNPVFTDMAIGVFPISLAAFVDASGNATWWWTTAPDLMSSIAQAVGFVPVQAGVISFTTVLSASQSRAATVRAFNGSIPGYPNITDTEVTLAVDLLGDVVSTITATVEPAVHGIIGAQLGDLEFDIGKSVPWASYFCNDVYITDVNLGRPRYWVIDWDKTFRSARYTSLTTDYFNDPATWRREQFLAADAAWNYGPDSWVLFIDGHEALSCDTRSSPDDVTASPFASFIHREISRASDLGEDRVALPFFAFVRNGTVTAQSYQIEDPDLVAQRLLAAGFDPALADSLNTAVVTVGVPYYYQPPTTGGLVRLVKVSALREPGFDWSILDRLTTPSANVKIQVVSYGYAHWLNQEDGADDGFEIRRALSRVMPLAGLSMLSADDPGVPGPYAVAVSGSLTTNPGVEPAAQIRTPMYHSVFRDNPRDGVWYLPGELGNRDIRVLPGVAAAVGIAFQKV